uniref:LysM domain-containing protein n=1 Tax=Oryza brachyantha TaxID=4533 RepID=J3L4Q0_ORYBR
MANLRATALLVAFLFVAVAVPVAFPDGGSLSMAHEKAHGAAAVDHYAAPKRETAATPICTGVHGVVAGETCDSIARRFHAGLGRVPFFTFVSLNPNINCRGLFVGQWVCIQGFFPV